MRQRRPSSDHTDQIFSSIRFEPHILSMIFFVRIALEYKYLILIVIVYTVFSEAKRDTTTGLRGAAPRGLFLAVPALLSFFLRTLSLYGIFLFYRFFIFSGAIQYYTSCVPCPCQLITVHPPVGRRHWYPLGGDLGHLL
jgi:hypothetical protein